MIFSRKFFAYLSAVLFATIIGFSFMFVKMAIQYANPLDVLAARFSIALLFSLIILLFFRPKLSICWQDIVHLLPIALLNPFMYFLTQALGLVYLPASEAGIIQATLPVFTLLFASWILNEKTSWIQKLSMGLSVFGVMYIFIMSGTHFGLDQWIGIILLGVSTLSHAGYNILARTMTQKYSMIDMTYLMIFTGFVSFNVLSMGQHLMRGTLSQFFLPFTHPLFVLSVSYLGVLASYITFFLSNFALSEIEASKFGVFTNLTTIISIFSGVVILHESIFYYHYIGAFLVIAGVIGVNVFDTRKENKNEPVV
ncbi:DMT family transporter [Sporolactobacillus sp. THM7-7]|nr:DMT family transporter [Sporolactobacillus sp. THM7-7]